MNPNILLPEFSSSLFFSIGSYLLLLLICSLYILYQQTKERRSSDKGSETDYFLAGRKISLIPSVVSTAVTESSAATVLIFPQIGFQGSMSLLWLPLGFIVGRWLVVRFYLPTIYTQHQLSIYAAVSQEGSSQVFLSISFLGAKFLSGGVRFFLAVYALSSLLGGGIWFWAFMIALIAGLYSLTGGLRAVVLTDQIQGFLLISIGIGMCIFFGVRLEEEFTLPSFINLQPSLSNSLLSPVLFLGGVILSIGSHGTDQDILQRILAVSNLKTAQRALFFSSFGALFIIGIYLLLGYILYLAVASGSLPSLNPKTPLIDSIRLLQKDVPLLPEMFAILLFAASMSTIDSAIHSTGAIWKSILSSYRMKYAERGGLRRFLDSGRLYSFLSLLFLCFFAYMASFLNRFSPDFFSLAMGSMNYIYGGMIAVFTSFVLDSKISSYRKISAPSVLAALSTGFGITYFAQFRMDPSPSWPLVTLASTGGALFSCLLVQKLVQKLAKGH